MNTILSIPRSTESKRLEKCIVSAFIDCSGSTSSNNILKLEIKIVCDIVNNIVNKNIVFWDDNIKGIYDNIDDIDIRPHGWTDPSVILDNDDTYNILKKSDVIIFCTDGCIDNNEVTKFSDKLNNIINNKTVINIIFTNDNPNVSCIAPLISKSLYNINIHYNINTNKLIMLSERGFNKDFSDISIIKDIYISNDVIPDGYILINQTTDINKLINIDKFMKSDISNIELSDKEWDNIIRYNIIIGKISEIRKKIVNIQYKETEKIENEVKSSLKYYSRKNDILNYIIKHNNIDNKEKDELKKELEDIESLATRESYIYNSIIKKKLKLVKNNWDRLRNIIYNIEKSNNIYDSKQFLNLDFGSNRAKRGLIITNNEYIKLNHNNVPEIECSIHLGKGPAVLWLRKIKDLTYSTNNKLVTFPFKHAPKLVECIVHNPVCGLCADNYMKVMNKYNDDNILTIYKEECIGYIPLNWKYTKNIKHSINILCMSYCGSRQVSHNKLLMISIIDDICRDHTIKPWIDRSILTYFKDQLICNVATYDTFSCQGNKVKVKEALKIVVKSRENMIRQPLSAGLRILLLALEYNFIDNKDTYNMVLYCIIYEMIDDYRVSTNKEGLVKRNKKKVYDKKEILDILSDIDNKDNISINDFSFFLKSYEIMYINRISEKINMNFNNDKILRYIVKKMININPTKKCMDIFNDIKPNFTLLS